MDELTQSEVTHNEKKYERFLLFLIVITCIGAGVLGYKSHGTPILQPIVTKVVTVPQVKCVIDDGTWPRIVTCSNGKVYSVDDSGVKVGR